MNIHTEWKNWKNLGENRAFFTHFFYSQWKFPVTEKFTCIYIHWAVCPRLNINTFFQLSENRRVSDLRLRAGSGIWGNISGVLAGSTEGG